MTDKIDSLQPHSQPIRLLYFWIGIVATIAYRVIVVLNNVSAVWVQVAWYIGTVGFIFYFAHRFDVSSKRARIIERYRLADRLQEISELTDQEKAAAAYVFSTLRSSKEKWNYIIIFVSSGLALIAGIILDFF
jgi:hypothetical protein